MSDYKLVVTYDKSGSYHTRGECSGAELSDYSSGCESVQEVDFTAKFVKKYCDSDGEVCDTGLSKLYKKEHCSLNSGYCGGCTFYTAKKAVLIKSSNVKKQFLEDYNVSSSDSEIDDNNAINYSSGSSSISISLPLRKSPELCTYVSKFDNPEYRKRVGRIKCNRGPECHRKNDTYRKCYYNHDP